MKTPKSKPRRGLFAFSADPITLGHLEVIRMAAARCDQLIVAVMNNDGKAGKYLFSIDERLKTAGRAVREAGILNATVIASGGLLADVYLKHGCDRLYRGVRNAEDRRYEKDQMRMQATILSRIAREYELIATGETFSLVSSTLVKASVIHHVDVSHMVPAFVKAMLEVKLLGQEKIGVIGGMAVGKTTLVKRLVGRFNARGGEAHLIDVDQLIRDLYVEDSPGAQQLREEIERLLGKGVLSADRKSVDRRVMAERFFSPTIGAAVYEEVMTITTPHTERKYREALAGKKGLIVVEWAQMAERWMSKWVNHRVIVVDAPPDDRARFLRNRGITAEQFDRVGRHQLTPEQKSELVIEASRQARIGASIIWTNRWFDDEAEAERVADELVDHAIILLHDNRWA